MPSDLSNRTVAMHSLKVEGERRKEGMEAQRQGNEKGEGSKGRILERNAGEYLTQE